MRTRSSSSQRFFYSVLRPAALLLGCAAALLCSRTSQLNAQTVHLLPQAGLYLPTRISVNNRSLDVRQKIGVTIGARLTLTFSERFDVVAGVTYLPGHATFRAAGQRIEVGTMSHLLTGTTGARYWLLGPARMLSWEVHTGFGVVFGGQASYGDLFESSTVSGILGTTVGYQVGRIVSLRLRVQDRLYRIRFGGRDPGSSRQSLRVTFGFGLPLVGAAP